MKTRIITAIIALIIVIPIAIIGNLPFEIFVLLLATLGYFEFVRINEKIKNIPSIGIGLIILWATLLGENHLLKINLPLTKSEIVLLFSLLLLVNIVISKNKFTFDDASFIIFATLYIGISFSYLIELRSLGVDYLLFTFLLIWATDSGAYFFGSAFGKNKLWPSISPNKTIEGAIGGIILALFVSFIFQLFASLNHSTIYLLIIAFIISIAAQIGDLIASSIKRFYNVKDFGNIMPGHGGVIDRLDSMMFVLPILAILQFIS